jgi:DNA gyrase subunit A
VAPGSESLVLVTASGVAKRLTPTELVETKSGRSVIALKPGDSLATAFTSPDGVDIVVVASDAQVLRTPVDGISRQGRSAGGVAGMAVKDAVVVAAGPALPGSVVVTVTSGGLAKSTPVEEIPTKGRGGSGVRVTRYPDKQKVTLAYVGSTSGLGTLMGTDADDTQLDPNPAPFPLDATKRDLVSVPTERRIHVVGPLRW